MSKIIVRNSFHNRAWAFSIKKSYIGNDPDFDALAALDYQVYTNGPDAKYAKRKLEQIKNELCGQPDCKCVNKIQEA